MGREEAGEDELAGLVGLCGGDGVGEGALGELVGGKGAGDGGTNDFDGGVGEGFVDADVVGAVGVDVGL